MGTVIEFILAFISELVPAIVFEIIDWFADSFSGFRTGQTGLSLLRRRFCGMNKGKRQ